MPLYKQSTKEILIQKLGHDREIFTRKSSQSFMTFLLENVHFLSRKLRVIVVKTQLFVNFYFIHHQGSVASYCFTPTFFYSVMQLVQGKQITSNTDKCSSDIITSWSDYNAYLLEWHQVDSQEILNTRFRQSDVLSEACTTMATAFHNNVADNFNQRVCAILKNKLQMAFPVIVKYYAQL